MNKNIVDITYLHFQNELAKAKYQQSVAHSSEELIPIISEIQKIESSIKILQRDYNIVPQEAIQRYEYPYYY